LILGKKAIDVFVRGWVSLLGACEWSDSAKVVTKNYCTWIGVYDILGNQIASKPSKMELLEELSVRFS